MKYFGTKNKEDTVEAMIRAAMMSVADICIIPMQDYLCLGSEARINTPSTLGNNWKWRISKRATTKKLEERLLELARIYART
jgi:4-alpha-glucanotransferase